MIFYPHDENTSVIAAIFLNAALLAFLYLLCGSPAL